MLRSVIGFINKRPILKSLVRIIAMVIGSVIYSIGVANFLDPNDVAAGGVTGCSVIMNRITGLETGTWYLILNVPIIFLGLWKFGIRFISSTAFCIVLTTVFTNYFATFPAVTHDMMLASLTGGALLAVGMAIVFRAGATTGGSDIIVKCLRLRYKYLKTGVLFFITDLVIISWAAYVLRSPEPALYALISVMVTSFVFDLIMYGRDGAKMIYVIGDHPEKITERFLLEMNIGVTHIQGQGAFSGNEKTVIMAVMRKSLSPKAEEIVREEDPEAFMIVTDATEIYGEGYKNIFSEKI